MTYYVINQGNMWHIRETETDRTVGFRQYFIEAMGLAEKLERQACAQ